MTEEMFMQRTARRATTATGTAAAKYGGAEGGTERQKAQTERRDNGGARAYVRRFAIPVPERPIVHAQATQLP